MKIVRFISFTWILTFSFIAALQKIFHFFTHPQLIIFWIIGLLVMWAINPYGILINTLIQHNFLQKDESIIKYEKKLAEIAPTKKLKVFYKVASIWYFSGFAFLLWQILYSQQNIAKIILIILIWQLVFWIIYPKSHSIHSLFQNKFNH